MVIATTVSQVGALRSIARRETRLGLRIARRLLAIVTLVCAPTLAAATPAPESIAQLENLPASNPYRAVLLRLETLPNADRAALKTWADYYPESEEPKPSLTAYQEALATEIRQSLIAAATAPAADSNAWPRIPNPRDLDNLTTIPVVSAGTIRELSRIATKSVEALPADQAIDTYAAVAQLGRQQRSGLTLIEQLTGVAIDGIAISEASRRLHEFSPEGLARLSAAWAALHPLPTNAAAVAGERDGPFLPMIERVIAPGLHALLADPDAGLDTSKTTGSSTADPFRDLRLSGLARLGPGDDQVSLENTVTGEIVTLRPGRPVEGLELVSIDFEQHRARLRRGDHEAFVDLRTKRVTELADAARQLRKLYDGFDFLSESGKGKTLLAATLARVRAHPEGVDGYVRDLLMRYQTGIDEQLARADSPDYPAATNTPPDDDPLLALTMPAIGKVCRTLNHSATYPAMLQAAVRQRLARTAATDPFAPLPADPWSEDGDTFAYQETPDGGFVLRSRYQSQPGAPLTFKFAAPDAGYQRHYQSPQ